MKVSNDLNLFIVLDNQKFCLFLRGKQKFKFTNSNVPKQRCYCWLKFTTNE